MFATSGAFVGRIGIVGMAVSVAAVACGTGAQAPPVEVRTVALTGHPVPGISGATWASFPDSARVDNTGAGLFRGVFRRAQGSESGLFRVPPGGAVEVVATSTQPVPGLPVGTTFGRLYGGAVNSAGEVYFHSDLSGPDVVYGDNPTYRATWLLRGGRLRLVARDGNPAPGTSERFRYTSGLTSGTPLTEDGSVMFRGELLPDWRSGVWYGRPGSDLRPILLEGQPVAGITGFSVGNVGTVHRSRGEHALVHADLAAPDWTPSGINTDAVFAGLPGDLRLVARVGAPAPGIGSTLQTVTGRINSRGEVVVSSRLADGNYPCSSDPARTCARCCARETRRRGREVCCSIRSSVPATSPTMGSSASAETSDWDPRFGAASGPALPTRCAWSR